MYANQLCEVRKVRPRARVENEATDVAKVTMTLKVSVRFVEFVSFLRIMKSL